jgi:hypothetical protein
MGLVTVVATIAITAANVVGLLRADAQISLNVTVRYLADRLAP